MDLILKDKFASFLPLGYVPPETVEEAVEEQQRNAYRQGCIDAYQQGFEDGLSRGRQEGYECLAYGYYK